MKTTLLLPRWLLSMKPGEGVLEGQALLIEGERIAAVGARADLLSAHPQAERIELAEHVLMPGLINSHTHSAMSLLRGVADDLGLMDWLNNHIWPLEKRWVSHEWTRLGSLFSAAEALRGGVTTLNDMYFFPEAMAEAALQAGIRAAVSINVIDFPTGYASGPDDYIAKGLAAYQKFKGEKLLQFTSSPHAPYTVSDETFVKLRDMAEQHDMRIHCHIHETQDEVDGGLKQFGVRPLERLEKLGLMNERMIAVHMVHLTDDEIGMLAKNRVHIAHNASSNLKLASGIARVADLDKAGVNVALGTDGAASNNRQDMFEEIRQAALLAKGSTGQPTVLNARRALEMATLGGAKALGRERDLGSLEVGKLADVIAVDLSAPECRPVYHADAQLVYVAAREHVSDVWVQGEQVLKARQLTRFDLSAVVAQVEDTVAKMKN
ncbi:5-methylthioadenosine/S-adenosylhomocysteine deaminase [Inhella inkyongensis]|uniref:5-methylthioadenosine/S-adenosylhomocysteine deaminase n=1 Tax=Inhella inkyongensis TaxID=392593 RepID=A0A840SBB7_9BURK|nr:TRZ/ATZ family hydrolase [Inhella inkyongensis]MBB5206296.1 5-methylthioadenosine/S-adenosylhomocysteine deaminase [Inhella inkyongensis]